MPHRLVFLVLTCLFVAAPARATLTLPDSFIWDRPNGDLTTPGSGVVGGTSANVDGLLGFLSLRLTPPPGAAAVAVTLVVPGSVGGFVRAILVRGDGEAELLSPNLREHTGLPEQLLMVVSAEDLGEEPTLEFHSSQAADAFLRVAVDWLDGREVLTAATERSPRVFFGAERIKHFDETNEGVPLTRQDRIYPRSVDAVLHTAPIRVDEGAEFAFDLGTVPDLAAFRAEVAGASLGEPLELWVNRHGPIHIVPSLPLLSDPGILRDGVHWIYAGWRPLALFIPGEWLSPGENMVVIQRAQSGAALPEMALRDVRLELSRSRPENGMPQEPLDHNSAEITLPQP
ncbi:MAG: hypothetical protein OHK005_05700 [Candidatus Methylacidiphilales bacterium]